MLDLTLPCNKSWLSLSLLTNSQAREQLSGRYKNIDLLNSNDNNDIGIMIQLHLLYRTILLSMSGCFLIKIEDKVMPFASILLFVR